MTPLLREPDPDEYLHILELLNNIPKRYRHLQRGPITVTRTVTKAYHLHEGSWLVEDDAPAAERLQQWWCPSETRVVDCPGPCPDGRLHTKMAR